MDADKILMLRHFGLASADWTLTGQLAPMSYYASPLKTGLPSNPGAKAQGALDSDAPQPQSMRIKAI